MRCIPKGFAGYLLWVVPVICSLVGCGKNVDEAGAGSEGLGETAAALARGQKAYSEWGCPQCHGQDRQGTRTGPAIQDLREQWTVKTLSAYLLDPERARESIPRLREMSSSFEAIHMPAYDYPEQERRALARWLLNGSARTMGE